MNTTHLIKFLRLFVLVTVAFSSNGCGAQEETQRTTLEEFMAMGDDKQKQLIIETQRTLMLEVADRGDLDHAECIANIFNGGELGIERFRTIKGILKEAANRQLEQSADELIELVIMRKHCPAAESE